MNNTVSLTKQNGEKIQAEIISYFEIVETSETYILTRPFSTASFKV